MVRPVRMLEGGGAAAPPPSSIRTGLTMGTYFGTDGIRGVAGELLTPEFAVLFAEPDGTNINAGCGSTHIGALQQIVAADGFDLGLAFDGDGDRVLAVDAAGALVDGDFIIAILARHLK